MKKYIIIVPIIAFLGFISLMLKKSHDTEKKEYQRGYAFIIKDYETHSNKRISFWDENQDRYFFDTFSITLDDAAIGDSISKKECSDSMRIYKRDRSGIYTFHKTIKQRLDFNAENFCNE